MVTWDGDCEAASQGEGWVLSECDSGEIQLQRLNEAGRFRTDEAAWLHVFDLVLERDLLACRAMLYLAIHSPAEFCRIARYLLIVRPRQVVGFARTT